MENSTEIVSLAVLALVRGCAETIALCDMIIACPACHTRYAVPDAAIGSEGRTVRCAKCKHSWFQEPPVLDLVRPAKPAPLEPQTDPAPATNSVDEALPAMPASAPGAEVSSPSISHWRTPDGVAADDQDKSLAVRALRRGLSQQPPAGGEDRVIVRADPPAALVEPDPDASGEADPPFDDEDDADVRSRFDYRAPFTRRRNTLRMWTLAAAIFAMLATGTVVAVNYYGLPEWVPLSRPTFGIGQSGLKLDFPKAQQRKETLESGETIFRVRGTITNTARETLAVPNLLVVFSDARERNVGDWLVVPSKRQLAPGETVTVTEAIANIPAGAAVADLGWAPN